MTEVIWTGESGRNYVFENYPINTQFDPDGACYIFVKENPGKVGMPSILGAPLRIGELPEDIV